MPNAGTIVVGLTADTKRFNGGITKAISKLTGLKGSSLAAVGGITAVGAALAVLGTKAVGASSRFELGMAKVRGITAATDKDFKTLRDTALELAATTKFTATEAAGAMQLMSQAGFSVGETTRSLGSVLNLATATFVDLATAADIGSSTLRGFGLQAKDMGRVSDVLAKAMTSTNTTLVDLGESLKLAAPLSATLGISLEETTAAIGLLGNVGIKGSLAGTALRRAMANLIKPSSEAASTIKDLGIETKDSEGNILGFVDIIKQLERAGADTEDVISIFGVRAGPALAALLSQGSDAVEEMTDKLKEAQGTVDEMAKIQLETLSGQFALAGSAAEKMAIAWGDALLPLIRDKIIPAIVDVIKWLEDAADGFRVFEAGISDLFKGKTGGAFREANRLRNESLAKGVVGRKAIGANALSSIDDAIAERAQKDTAKEALASARAIRKREKASKEAAEAFNKDLSEFSFQLNNIEDTLVITSSGLDDFSSSIEEATKFSKALAEANRIAAKKAKETLFSLPELTTADRIQAGREGELAEPFTPGPAVGSQAAPDVLGRQATQAAELDKMNRVLDTSTDIIKSSAGEIGEFAGSIAEAAKAGPLAAVIAAIAAIVQRTQSFSFMMEAFSRSLNFAAKVIEPIVAMFKPLMNGLIAFSEMTLIVGDLLAKIVSAMDPFAFVVVFLEESLRFVGGIMFNISGSIVGFFMKVSNAIADVLERIPIIGKGLARKVRITEDSLKGSAFRPNAPGGSIPDILGRFGDALEDTTDTIRDVNEELLNVPSGFRVALRRFESSEADDPATAGGPSVSAVTVNIDAVDPTAAYNQMKQVQELQNFITSSSSQEQSAPYAIPREGS